MPSCTIASSWLSSHSLPCDMGFLSVGEETRWFAYFSLNKFDNRSITLWYNALCLITLDFPLPTSIQFTHWKLFITSRCVTSIVHRSPYQIYLTTEVIFHAHIVIYPFIGKMGKGGCQHSQATKTHILWPMWNCSFPLLHNCNNYDFFLEKKKLRN